MERKILLTFMSLLFFSFVQSQVLLSVGEVDAKVINTGESPVLRGPSVLNNDGYFVWGGSVIKGEDGKYHMFYSRWRSGEDHDRFSEGWLTGSEIAYAVSDYPDHDFKYVKTVIRGRAQDGDAEAWDAQSVHNPHIKRFNGKYYLYHTGTRYPGIQPAGSPGEKLSKRDLIQQSQQLGVVVFNSISDMLKGNIVRSDKPLLGPRTRVKDVNVLNPSPEGTIAKPDNLIVVNPSVVYRPSDKKYLLYFKGNLYAPYWRGVHGIALSDNPDGPFVPKDEFVFDLKDKDGKLASAEDPYVWFDSSASKFYAVFKDFTGAFTGSVPGLAMMWSDDGEVWKQTDKPMFMQLELKLKNGETIKMNRLERPQLLIGDKGMPEALYLAASVESVGDKRDGSSFNVQLPIKINKK